MDAAEDLQLTRRSNLRAQGKDGDVGTEGRRHLGHAVVVRFVLDDDRLDLLLVIGQTDGRLGQVGRRTTVALVDGLLPHVVRVHVVGLLVQFRGADDLVHGTDRRVGVLALGGFTTQPVCSFSKGDDDDE